MSKIVLERIHQVLGNLVGTYNINKNYVDKDDQILVILTATVFEICLKSIRLKYYSPGQLGFGCDKILPK